MREMIRKTYNIDTGGSDDSWTRQTSSPSFGKYDLLLVGTLSSFLALPPPIHEQTL